MEIIAIKLNDSEFSVSDLDSLGVWCGVNGGTYFQPFARGGGSDQIDNDLMTHQRPPPPIHADIGKQAVLNLVPFAGARREVTYPDR